MRSLTHPHAVLRSFKDLLAVLQPLDLGLRDAGDGAVQVHSGALRHTFVLQFGCEVWGHLEPVATGGSRLYAGSFRGAVGSHHCVTHTLGRGGGGYDLVLYVVITC